MTIYVIFEDITLPPILVHAGRTNRLVFYSDLLSGKVHQHQRMHFSKGVLQLNDVCATIVMKEERRPLHRRKLLRRKEGFLKRMSYLVQQILFL